MTLSLLGVRTLRDASRPERRRRKKPRRVSIRPGLVRRHYGRQGCETLGGSSAAGEEP